MDREQHLLAEFDASSFRQGSEFLQAAAQSLSEELVHTLRPDRSDTCNIHESLLLLLLRERSPRFRVRVELADSGWERRREQTERARSSAQVTQRVCNRPHGVAQRLPGRQPSTPTARGSLSTSCGMVQIYGSSSSLSTRGVGRWRGLPLSPCVVIAKVCFTFNVLSTTTTSFSEMLVTRNLPPSRSPRWTFRVSLLPLSWRIAVSTYRGVPMIPM